MHKINLLVYIKDSVVNCRLYAASIAITRTFDPAITVAILLIFNLETGLPKITGSISSL